MDWKKLKHAQGPATRLPKQIEALAAAKANGGEQAYLALAEVLFAPGEWFSASAPAAAELAKLVAARKGDVTRALWLLGDMLAGDHVWRVGEAAVKGAKRKLAEAAATSASAALAPATKLLASKDARERGAAVFFLAMVSQSSTTATIAKLAESDESSEVRTGAATALGFLARGGDAAARTALLALDGRADPAGTWAGKTIAGIDTKLAEMARGASAWFAPFDRAVMPWAPAEATAWVAKLLAGTPEAASAAPAIVRTVAAGERGARATRKQVVALALELAGFTRDFEESEIALPEKLSAIQRETAEALTGMPDVVLTVGWGLPGSARCVSKWLGLTSPSPLEETVTGTTRRWQKARAAVDKKGKTTPVAVAMNGLEPAKQLEVAHELLTGAYRILSDSRAKVAPADLRAMAEAAGKSAVPWARAFLTAAAEEAARDGDTFLVKGAHLAVAFEVLLESGAKLDPIWDDLIEMSDAGRPFLEAISPERRSKAILRRLAKEDDLGRGMLIADLVDILDLFSSKEVLAKLREALESPETRQEVDDDVLDALGVT